MYLIDMEVRKFFVYVIILCSIPATLLAEPLEQTGIQKYIKNGELVIRNTTIDQKIYLLDEKLV